MKRPAMDSFLQYNQFKADKLKESFATSEVTDAKAEPDAEPEGENKDDKK
jgi:hypothetical protein